MPPREKPREKPARKTAPAPLDASEPNAPLAEEPPPPPPPLHRADALAAVALFLAGFLAVMATLGDLGWTWDESYYLPPARLTIAWTKIVFSEGLSEARSPEVLARHWGGAEVIGQEEPINELPGVCKWLWALSLTLLESSLGPMGAMRLPSAMVFGLTLAAIFALCRRFAGLGVSVFGALCYLALPRVFGHAHLAATETIMAFLALATTLAFERGVSSGRWAIVAGLAFGVALATKINAFFLFPALFAWAYAHHRERLAHPVAAMIFLGPPVFVLLWPWLWRDAPARVLEYLSFHARHQETAVFYMGQKRGFDQPGAPWHYPFVLLAISTPPLILAFMALGMAAALRRWRHPMAGLLLIQALLPMLIIAAPGQPKYDGVRLFLPAFPFLACLSAFGLSELRGRLPNRERFRKAFLPAVFVALTISGGIALGASRPFYLSYFNSFVGGVSDAWEAGFETIYWGEAANQELIDWLNDAENVPAGSSIAVRAMFDRVLKDYQAWGWLRKDLLINELPPASPHGPEPAFDFHILQARRGFWGRIDWEMALRAGKARHVIEHRGAPMLYVFGSLAEILSGSSAS